MNPLAFSPVGTLVEVSTKHTQNPVALCSDQLIIIISSFLTSGGLRSEDSCHVHHSAASCNPTHSRCSINVG